MTGRAAVANWKYLEVPCSGSAVGFLAGQPTGVYCHAVGKRSRPCRSITSNGALSCPLCAKNKPTWRGYTPLYDREYCWRFVVVTEEYRESVSEIARFTQIKLFRGKRVTDCVVIRAENWRTLAIPASADRDPEPDLVPRLLILWGDEQLAAWHYSSDVPVSIVPTPAVAPTAAPCTPEREAELMGGLIRARLAWPGKDSPDAPGPQLLGDVLDAVPKPNGKHRRK